MPLSEEELRLLEQMERALVEEDPKFASTLRGTTLRKAARRRAIIAGVVFVVGVVLLLGGAISSLWAVGLVGFVIMLGSAMVGLSALRGQQHVPVDANETTSRATHPSGLGVIEGGRSRRRGRTRSAASSGSFMERMEQRWRRRRERGF